MNRATRLGAGGRRFSFLADCVYRHVAVMAGGHVGCAARGPTSLGKLSCSGDTSTCCGS
jgi:hypothetical protein